MVKIMRNKRLIGNKGVKMAKEHSFSFIGGERLTKMGATWFVSYLFCNKRDKTHFNWKKVCHKSRISVFNKTSKYHSYWLQQILNMNDKKLNTNEIELKAEQVKEMAKILLTPENINTTEVPNEKEFAPRWSEPHQTLYFQGFGGVEQKQGKRVKE